MLRACRRPCLCSLNGAIARGYSHALAAPPVTVARWDQVLLLCGGLFARRPEVARRALAAVRPPRSSALRWWMLVGYARLAASPSVDLQFDGQPFRSFASQDADQRIVRWAQGSVWIHGESLHGSADAAARRYHVPQPLDSRHAQRVAGAGPIWCIWRHAAPDYSAACCCRGALLCRFVVDAGFCRRPTWCQKYKKSSLSNAMPFL